MTYIGKVKIYYVFFISKEGIMATIKRIGMFTSGGDCGGLNAVIKRVAREAYSQGIESVVIPIGYAGLYNLGGYKDNRYETQPYTRDGGLRKVCRAHCIKGWYRSRG